MSRSFNGTSDYIVTSLTFGTIVPLTSSPVSISGWAFYASGAGSFPQLLVNVVSPNVAGTQIFGVGINIGSSHAGWNFFYNGFQSQNNSAPATNAWYQVVATYDGAAIKVYVNGSDVTNGNSGSVGGVITSTNVLNFGSGVTGGNSYWKGNIADVAVWTTALTAAEALALAGGARPYTIREASLLGFWPLDGLQSPEPDLSGNAHNGTLNGTALASGPPTMMFTPRWPQFNAIAAGGGSAIKFRKTLSQIGGRVGTRQPIGWGI